MPKPDAMRGIMFRIPQQLHRLLRMRAAREDKSIQTVATEAIQKHVGKQDEAQA